ncbi:MAG: FlgD immunoglobulin-like domain containing protein [Candidatus Cloacimonadales bacterium]|nr:FlgD immunoglobulin-like domain containing protein [Candidatus Cloacimonadales bacterium]
MRTIFLIIVFLLICFAGLSANPISPLFLSEFQFNNYWWFLEISDFYEFGLENLDGCSLASNNCTSYFENGITCNENGVFLVYHTDVQPPFAFNHLGDTITFESPMGMDEISFGIDVNPPYGDQTLARFTYWYGIPPDEDLGSGLAKNSYSTMGSYPFCVNSSGVINGFVYDSMMNPVPSVHLEYNYYTSEEDEIYTDGTGYFSAYLLGRNYNLNIHLDELASLNTTITVEPDSIYFFEFIFENYVHSDDYEISLPAFYYKLSNHPNPFNPSTEISFETTNLHEDARIEIYNSKGQKVTNLPITQSPNHQISVEWDGTNSIGKSCPSGVYLYKLVSGEKELAANKMLLLK